MIVWKRITAEFKRKWDYLWIFITKRRQKSVHIYINADAHRRSLSELCFKKILGKWHITMNSKEGRRRKEEWVYFWGRFCFWWGRKLIGNFCKDMNHKYWQTRTVFLYFISILFSFCKHVLINKWFKHSF